MRREVLQFRVMLAWWIVALAAAAPVRAEAPITRPFALASPGEVVATITAGCARCEWGATGREAVLLELDVDGIYSQHLALIRGERPAPYRVMLGRLRAGPHQLTVRSDTARSAKDAGPATIVSVDVRAFGEGTPEYTWLSRAPFLRARPGTVERFSDFPLLMYVETDVAGEGPGPYRYQYTVIFTNEDGGTPADRLMATWGRTTDIEFVYGITTGTPEHPAEELIQAAGHRWVAFGGPRVGSHPILWVATDNNMVADHGADDLIRFAPAPEQVALGERSREAVMDAEPWTYAVTSAEAVREGRVGAGPLPRSGVIPDPRRYAVVEACAEVADATLAFDVGMPAADGSMAWYPTDRGEPAFRIARGGCFRAGAPLPSDATAESIAGLRVRAYPRPPREGEKAPPAAARVTLRRVNKVFMLDARYRPSASPWLWSGELPVRVDGNPLTLPLRRD